MNNNLSVLIVEDTLLFAVELEMLIKDIGYNVVGRVDNSAEALEIIYSDSPDLILMDIDIKGKLSGLEIGERIKHLDIPVLYITSHGDDSHYAEAEKSNMIGYLVKPVNKFSLKSAIKLAVKSLQSKSKSLELNVTSSEKDNSEEEEFILKGYLFFKKKDVYKKVLIDEILFLEADGDYVVVHLSNKEKFTTRMKFSEMENIIPADKFMKVHRSFIVQLKKIEAINFQVNTLNIESHTIPVSRSNKDKLANSIQKFS